MDAHSFQFGQVVGYRFGGVVGQEGVADARRLHPVQEVDGEGEELAAQIDGSVHVQGKMFDLAQFRLHFGRKGLVVILFHVGKDRD